MDDPLTLGGGRFSLTREPGPPPVVVKTGPADPLAREARAMLLMAGVDGVPALVDASRGRLAVEHLPGGPRALDTLAPADLRALGALLARIHARGTSPTAGLPWWASPETEPAAYAAHRAGDAQAALARGGHHTRIAPPRCDGPFRPVHGDLVAENIVWAPAPHLVDWEFWHHGDPAEDLAYLAEVNHLGDAALRAVAEGHGDPAALERAVTWRPLVAAEAAAWWIDQGRDDLAAPLLERLGLSRPSGPSARHRPSSAGVPAGGTPPRGARPG